MRIKFFNHLFLFVMGVSLLFSSCKKDDDSSPETINVSNSTWVYDSDADVTAGVTLKLLQNTYEYTTINYDGVKEVSRGTFANVPPYEVAFMQEDGKQFARALKKGTELEMEIFMQGGATPQFQDHAYITALSNSPAAYKNITLKSGSQGSYIPVPSNLTITVKNDTIDGVGAAQDWVDVTLAWDAVAGATQYRIYRDAAPNNYENPYFSLFRTGGANPLSGGGYSNVAYKVVAGDTTSIVLPLQSANVEYNYYVAAYNQQMPLGSPAYQYKINEAVGAVPVNPTYKIIGGQIKLEWDRNFVNSAYKIYQVSPSGQRVEVAMIAANASTESMNKETYTVAQDVVKGGAFVSGEAYTFQVTAFTAMGVETGATAFATTFYDKVNNFVVAFDEDGVKMLTWDKVLYAKAYDIFKLPSATSSLSDTTGVAYKIATADNEIPVSSLSLDYSTDYNLVISSSENDRTKKCYGEFSDVLSGVNTFPVPASATASETGTDTVRINWAEVRTTDVEADSYIVSYVYVDSAQQVSDLKEYGKIKYDFAKKVTVGTYSKNDAAGNSSLWYDRVPATFELDYILPNKSAYGTYKFFVQANGNGTQSDAVIPVTIIVQE